MNLKNKIVVITGASQGLGKSLAIKLSKQGAKIALLARSEDKLKKTKKTIQSFKGIAEVFVCNISKPDQIKSTVQSILKKFKAIDILINNAGIWLEGSTEKSDPEKINTMFQANTLGAIYLTSAVIPCLKKQPQATILNVISVAGVEPSKDWSIYTASKYAMRGFTDSLKQEMQGTNIKVIGFYPGGMNTNLFINAGRQAKNEPWMMKKQQIADILIFLLTQPKDIVIDHLEVRKFFGK